MHFFCALRPLCDMLRHLVPHRLSLAVAFVFVAGCAAEEPLRMPRLAPREAPGRPKASGPHEGASPRAGGLACSDTADGFEPWLAAFEAQAAAIRGLLEAYLATSDEGYRTRAAFAYAALEKQFWMDDVHLYRSTAGESVTMKYTSLRIAALQGALRQYWKLVASKPGQEDEAKKVLERVGTTMKLVVNGWNDTNKDGVVQPDECLGARLQMAERALTGEFSIAADKGDRDHDCVPDIATAKLPAALAGEITIERVAAK